jgi:hypothetical protein
MTEVSMAGSVVVIKPNRGGQITLTEFADDSDPIVIPDLEIRKGGMNLNGNLVSWAAPNPITVSLSVIPNTPSDKALSALIRACHLGGKSNTIGDAFISAMTISVPASVGNIGTKSLAISNKSTKWTFNNGYITSGPAAQGTNAEGKASTKTYTFTFESCANK